MTERIWAQGKGKTEIPFAKALGIQWKTKISTHSARTLSLGLVRNLSLNKESHR